MAEYTRITDPNLQMRVGARYATEITSLKRAGFRPLSDCLELLGPFSAVFQLPVLLLSLSKREVLVFPRPLRLAVANALLAHSEPPSIALCMGLGVKIYTAFTDNTLLISSTFQSRALPAPTSPIGKPPPSPTVELAWSDHRTRPRNGTRRKDREVEHRLRRLRRDVAPRRGSLAIPLTLPDPSACCARLPPRDACSGAPRPSWLVPLPAGPRRRFQMPQIRDWQGMRDMSARLLKQRTGEDVDTWNGRIKGRGFGSEKSLRTWLTKEGLTGYAQTLLVMERFGYPDFLLASADELVDGQYADRPQLRPIFRAIIDAAAGLGEVVVQTRKSYVSLVTPRRTFARIQPSTKTRVDLGLRLEGTQPGGRLRPSKIHETMQLQIGLTAYEEIDSEVLGWLQKAYDQNR